MYQVFNEGPSFIISGSWGDVMEFNRDIRMRGKGTVHFIDEEKRPRELTGEIIVDFESIVQDVYVKVRTMPKSVSTDLENKPETINMPQYLMPFKSVLYIEWQ